MRIRTDEGVLTLKFEPSEHKTAESAAKAFYEALKPKVLAAGQQIETELAIHSPEEMAEYLDGKYPHWWVVWEAGPYDWGICASLQGLSGPNWWTEPYYGFDVLFIED